MVKHYDKLTPDTDQLERSSRCDHLSAHSDQPEKSRRCDRLAPTTGQPEVSSRFDCIRPNTDQLGAGDLERNTNANGSRPPSKTKPNVTGPTKSDKNPTYAATQYPNLPPGQYLYIPPNTYNPNPTYYRYPGNKTPVDLAPETPPTQIILDDRLGCPYDTLSSLSPEALIIVCIMVSIFFFFPTGLAAVVFALMSLIARNGGNIPQAKFYSLLAQRLVVISVVITVFLMALVVLILIVMFIVFAGSVHNVDREHPAGFYKPTP